MIRTRITRIATTVTTAEAAMIAIMAVAPAAAVAAVLPAVAATRLEAEARDRAADRAAAVGPKVVVKANANPGKTRTDTFRERMLARAKPMTLLGGSFHLFESKYFVAIRRAERLILLIQPPNFVYTQ
jgi:hypothetical protein